MALVATLERLANKPTDFTFAVISVVARLAAEMLSPTPSKRVTGAARRPDGTLVTWEQTEITDHLG